MFQLIGRTKFGFQYTGECFDSGNETLPTKILASNLSRLYLCIYIYVNIILHTVSFVALPLFPPISSVPTPEPSFTLKLIVLRDLYFCGSLENPQKFEQGGSRENFMPHSNGYHYQVDYCYWLFHELSDSKTPICLESVHQC